MKPTSLEDAVDAFVNESLSHYTPLARGPKVIHDPILGTNVFSQEEVAVMDLPLVQRLRHISQTDVASLVYPAWLLCCTTLVTGHSRT